MPQAGTASFPSFLCCSINSRASPFQTPVQRMNSALALHKPHVDFLFLFGPPEEVGDLLLLAQYFWYYYLLEFYF